MAARLLLLVVLVCGLAADARAQLTSSLYASGFSQPIAFVQDPTDASVQLVVQQGGRIRVISHLVTQAADFLDLTSVISSGGERGLLGFAFAPDYASSGRFYVNFTNLDGHTVVARFRRSANPLVADPASRFDLRWGGSGGAAFITQPYANHNGGHLVFGPDGFLYVGLGDGGSGNDPEHRAQNPNELLGKMLRVDVNVPDSHAIGYVVPPDNPFVGSVPIAARHEIWSFGWRNPWRFSFDDPVGGGTGALVAGDVGQGAFEEIDYEPSGRGGRNYGWRNREGAVSNVTTLPVAYQPLTDPIHTYGRAEGQSVTGGIVYRGRALGTAYAGRYFFADFVAGRVWSIPLTIDPATGEATAGTRAEHTAELGGSIGNISSFGLDANRELYLVSYSGNILRVSAVAAVPVITVQPVNRVTSVGGSASFTVEASGAPVPFYQWQVSANGTSWTNLTNTAQLSGVSSATLTISNATASLGTLQYRVTAFSTSGFAISNVATLTVQVPSGALPPFGAFDTPIAGGSVSGSIAVTGWALDDLGVERVEIWRDPVAGETTPVYDGPGPGAGKIFIANPVFIGGARPDIERAYGTLPFANRSGWGYLLLTQGLWNQGNGTYTLYAFAYDAAGRANTLGSKTIAVNNAAATRPFGAIDTPGYGATVSGSIWNFGWALTPNGALSCTIPANGVQVAIDSGPLLPVTYGDLRPDIAAAFPSHTNSSGAGGAYYFDTTALSNGTHQIGWFVTDSCGRAEGVGSRLFTVQNGMSTAEAVPDSNAVAHTVVAMSDSAAARHNAVGHPFRGAGPAGPQVVRIKQGERVEVPLPASSGPYAGYQAVNGERRPLPIGSSLDAEAGVFYWQPAAAFLGAHDLEFVASTGEAVRVRAIVGTSVQAAIDTPSDGSKLGSFTVAGWAIEEAATVGTGIDTVHVWAYPASGAVPIFLGVAEYGDSRTDIGALFGEQFTGASFSLFVDQLDPGKYDIVVYPHSAVTGDFRGARVVRVTVR